MHRDVYSEEARYGTDRTNMTHDARRTAHNVWHAAHSLCDIPPPLPPLWMRP